MSLQATNLLIQGSQLPAEFRGSPNDLFQAMLARMRIVSPSGVSFFVVSDTEPAGNQGPWLKGGVQWWVFDPNLKRYVPLDISESETRWFWMGSTTPPSSNPPVWLKTDGAPSEAAPDAFGNPVAWFTYNGTTWVRLPTIIDDRSLTANKLFWTANLFGTASGTDTYSINFSPDTGFTLGDGSASTFFFLVRFMNANTGAITLNVNGSGAKSVKKFTGENIVGGEILAGSIHLLTFDGTNFQLVSGIAPVRDGSVLNVFTKTDGTTVDTALTIPFDNTPPQNSEGAPYNQIETTYTAIRAGSTLLIELHIAITGDVPSNFVIALFRDSEPDAIASIVAVLYSVGNLRAVITGVDTLPHTYRVRFGSSGVATPTHINPPYYGGTFTSSLTITEVSA